MKNKTNVKDFFNSRASFYNTVSNWTLNEDLNRKTDECLKNISGDIAIELGAGTGVLISRLKNFKRKIAFDISMEMLNEISDNSIEKVIGDVHLLNFPNNYFDLIICRQLLHYCDLDVTFQNIKNVLKTSGVLHIVQVVEIKKVPERWDQKWVDLRKVNNRKHSRTKDLETCFNRYSFKVLRDDALILRDLYTWPDFFKKNNISKDEEENVRLFFKQTPKYIANAIKLKFDDTSISYNRLFKFWLLKND